MSGSGLQLMTVRFGPESEQDRARWRAELRRLGVEGARGRLARALTFEPNEIVEIGVVEPWPPREFVEAWLHEQDRRVQLRDTRRFWVTVVLAFIAAVASLVAAKPELQAWWHQHGF